MRTFTITLRPISRSSRAGAAKGRVHFLLTSLWIISVISGKLSGYAIESEGLREPPDNASDGRGGVGTRGQRRVSGRIGRSRARLRRRVVRSKESGVYK